MAKKKIYKIETNYDGRIHNYEGTLEQLIDCFSYTLEIGHSWNNKINRYPKTIKTFVKNLQSSYEEKEASCYKRTFVSLKD